MEDMVEQQKFWDRVEKAGPDECWLWKGPFVARKDGARYGSFGHSGRAHRIAWALANGPIPPGLVVRHKCDNPPCVNPAHLLVGTHADNVRDRDKRGRQVTPLGSKHANHKLTEEQVVDLRQKLASGMTQRQAARFFGISQYGVWWAAKVGWRHVQ